MFSCTSTNTSMSAKRRTTLLARGTLRMLEMASASGRLLLPATSLIAAAPAFLRFASRVSKGIVGTPLTSGGLLASDAALCKRLQQRRLPAAPWSPLSRCGRQRLNWASVDGLGLRQQLDDALHGRPGRLVCRPAPGAVQRALGDLVLLRHGAELLALRVLDQPFDVDRLLAVLGLRRP